MLVNTEYSDYSTEQLPTVQYYLLQQRIQISNPIFHPSNSFSAVPCVARETLSKLSFKLVLCLCYPILGQVMRSRSLVVKKASTWRRRQQLHLPTRPRPLLVVSTTRIALCLNLPSYIGFRNHRTQWLPSFCSDDDNFECNKGLRMQYYRNLIISTIFKQASQEGPSSAIQDPSPPC